MSLNGFMHSRNIYKTKPNFAEMAKTYPSFGRYVRTDLRGKVIFDYNDCNALRELTKTLLKKDFDLEVDIPEDRLIPTVPQRLNYILFVEDLVSKLCQFLNSDEEVIGLDVGTGCCAVFPLIGCTINKNWSFVATDVDPINIESALNNVRKNNLNHRINVIECEEDNGFVPIVESMDKRIHFLMTNPPFFSDHFNDSDVSRDESDIQMDLNSNPNESHFESKAKYSRSNRKKSSANTSNPIESVVVGGEVEFVSKIIEKSLKINNKLMIFSAMLGKKSSLKTLKNIIKSYIQKEVIFSCVCTEFCQGFTKRWGIAWTAIKGLNLRDIPITKSVKPKSPLIYYLPPLLRGFDYTIGSVSDKIKSLLINDLKLDSFEVKETKKRIEFLIRSDVNVWSNQRKRKREMKRKTETNLNISGSDEQKSDICSENESNIELNSIETKTMKGKRGLDEMDCEENPMDCNSKKSKTSKEYSGNELYLLDSSLVIRREKQTILMEMQTKELAKSKESTHQLFQYFKNNLN